MNDVDSHDLELLDHHESIVLEAVEQAVALYAGIASPAYLAEMRVALADVLMMHPATQTLIRSLEERPARRRSGESPVDDAPPLPTASEIAKKATGGGT